VSLAFAVALIEILEDGGDGNPAVLIKRQQDNAPSVLSFVRLNLTSIFYMN